MNKHRFFLSSSPLNAHVITGNRIWSILLYSMEAKNHQQPF